MCELIYIDLGLWNHDKVHSVFNPMEEKKIMSIPLSRRLPEDIQIWHCEKDDVYSVRFPYHLLLHHNSSKEPRSSINSHKKILKAIRNLFVIPKVQIWSLRTNCRLILVQRRNFVFNLCAPLFGKYGQLEMMLCLIESCGLLQEWRETCCIV